MKKSKKNRFIIISLLVLFLGGGGIILFLVQKQPTQTAENSSVSSPTKKETQKLQEEQAQIDQKLNTNSKSFLYKGVWEWRENDPRDYDRRHVFRGIENGQEFFLVFFENHSTIASLNQKQEGTLALIEGVENIPLQSNGRVGSWKKINLSDKITITNTNS